MNQIFTRFRGILFIFLSITAFGRLYSQPRLTPDEEIMRIGGMEEPLPLDELIRVSLIASGVEDADLGKYIGKMKGVVDSAPRRSGTAEEDAEVLLEWMHDEILSFYVLTQTRMDTLLDNGRYNCVSSAVMYLILARSRGIRAGGVLTSDHAFCRVGDIDVETTTAFGFDPGTRREAVDSFTGRTGFTYVPPGNYRERQDIGEKELISLIYQNRIAELQRLRRWEDAVGLARDRWALAGSASAERDFMVSIINYAAYLDHQKKEIEGLVFLNRAAEVLGTGNGLEETATALLGNGVSYYLRAGNAEGAQTLLNDKDLTALVPADFVARQQKAVEEKFLEKVVKSAPFQEASAAVDEAFSNGLIDRSQWEKFTIYLWSGEAAKRASGGDWLQGWLFIKEAPGDYRNIAGWSRMEQTYRHNSEIIFHNRFAEAVKDNNYSEARDILSTALELFPDSVMLHRDLETLDNLR